MLVTSRCVADSVFEQSWVEARRVSANAIFAECLDIASQHERGLDVGMEHGFAEGVQRAKGRYDILYGFNGNSEFMEVDSKLRPVLAQILECKHRLLLFNGLLHSNPASSEQLWHADGEHLFAGTEHCHLPVHSLNVFVPLVDITEENGGTEFCLGSHRLTGASDRIVWQDAAHRDRIGSQGEPVAFTCRAGSVILFDYRILHRGLANSTQASRPVLYFTYARAWFRDVRNFPERVLVPERNIRPASRSLKNLQSRYFVGDAEKSEDAAAAASALLRFAPARGWRGQVLKSAGVRGFGGGLGVSRGGGGGSSRRGVCAATGHPHTGARAFSSSSSSSSFSSSSLDIAVIRAEFPALVRLDESGVVLCDGAGGSQVHSSVLAAMQEQLIMRNCNVGAPFMNSVSNLEALASCRQTMAAFFNCKAEEVVFGNNATTLTFHMARSLARDPELNIGPGDNVVVTCMDHACNVGPWEALARDTGAQLRRIVVDRSLLAVY